MRILKTILDGVLIIEPTLHYDDRGYFMESFNNKEFNEEIGQEITFVQDNESKSSKNVLRGLHFQSPPYAQSKLVRCVNGAVLDIALDIRNGSPTYGKATSIILTQDNHTQFFIPKGFAHGFMALTDGAIFQYKCDEYYHKESEGGINILDDSIDIGFDFGNDFILSEKDKLHPLLKDFNSPFTYNQ